MDLKGHPEHTLTIAAMSDLGRVEIRCACGYSLDIPITFGDPRSFVGVLKETVTRASEHLTEMTGIEPEVSLQQAFAEMGI